MINIPLIENYRIKSDNYQYILVFEQNGREYPEAYCRTIEACIQIFVERKIRSFNATSLHLLCQDVKAFQTRLNLVLQPLNLKVVAENCSDGVIV